MTSYHSIRNSCNCFLLLALICFFSFASISCSSHSAKVDEAAKTVNPEAVESPAREENIATAGGAAKPEKPSEDASTKGANFEKAAVRESLKIGAIDLQKVAEESAVGKNSTFEYNLLAKSKQAQISEKNQDIEKLRRELEEQGPGLSEEAMKQKLGELENLETGLSRFGQDAEAELGKKYEELYSSMLKDVLEMAAQIGTSEDYTIILDKGSILYCDKNLDITDLFVKKFDAFRESKRTGTGTSPGK
jgi:outer membrane protein